MPHLQLPLLQVSVVPPHATQTLPAEPQEAALDCWQTPLKQHPGQLDALQPLQVPPWHALVVGQF